METPEAGQVWLTKSGNLAYLFYHYDSGVKQLCMLWYDGRDGEISSCPVRNQLETKTNLTFVQFAQFAAKGTPYENNSVLEKP